MANDFFVELSDRVSKDFGKELEARLKQLQLITRQMAKDTAGIAKGFNTAFKQVSTSAKTATTSTGAFTNSLKSASAAVTGLVAKTSQLNTEEARATKTKRELATAYKASVNQVINLRAKLQVLARTVAKSNASDSKKAILLRRITAEHARLSKVMRVSNDATAKYSSVASKGALTSGQFSTKVRDLSRASVLLGSRLGSVAASISLVGSAVVSLGPAAAVVVASLGSLIVTLKAVELGFRVFSKLAKEGIESTTGVFADFNFAMTQTAIAAGQGSGAIELLGEAAKETALDVTLSSTEMAGGLLTLSRAGFLVQDQLASIPAAANLAVGGFTSLATSTDITTTIIKAFGLSTSEANEIANQTVAVVNSSKTSVEGLRISYGFAAVASAQFGLKVSDMNTALAILADSGLRASTSATALRGLFGALAKGGDRLQAQLIKVGLTLNDVNVKALGFEQVLLNLANAQNLVTGEMFDADAAFKSLGLRIAPATLALIKGAKGYGTYKKSIEGTTAATDAAEKAMASLKGRILLLKNTVENLRLEIGEEVSNAMVEFINNILGARKELDLLSAAVAASAQWVVQLVNSFSEVILISNSLEPILKNLAIAFDEAWESVKVLTLGMLEFVSLAIKAAIAIKNIQTLGTADTSGLEAMAGALDQLSLSMSVAAAQQTSFSDILDHQLAKIEANKKGYDNANEALKTYSGHTELAVEQISSLIAELGELESTQVKRQSDLEKTNKALSEQVNVNKDLAETLVLVGFKEEEIDKLRFSELETVGELQEALRGVVERLKEVQKEKKKTAEEDVEFGVNVDTETAEGELKDFQVQGDLIRINPEIVLPEDKALDDYKDLLERLESGEKIEVLAEFDQEALEADLRAKIEEIEERNDLVINVDADTLPARDELDELLKDITLGETEIPLTIEEEELIKDVDAFLTDEISQLKGVLQIDANTQEALRRVNEIIALSEGTKTAVTIGANTVPARKDLNQLLRDIESGKIKVDANTEAAVRKIVELEKTIKSTDTTLVVHADTEEALGKVNDLINTIEEAEEEDNTVVVKADVSQAKEELSGLAAIIEDIVGKVHELSDFSEFGGFSGASLGESRQSLEEAGIEIPPHLSAWNNFIRRRGPSGRWRFIPLNEDGSRVFFSEGGKVGVPQGGTKIPGYGGGDSIPMRLSPGSYVLNKKSTKTLEKLQKGIGVPVKVEPGETLFNPSEAKNMGYDFLSAINSARGEQGALLSALMKRLPGFSQGGSVSNSNISNSHNTRTDSLTVQLQGQRRSDRDQARTVAHELAKINRHKG